MDEVRGREKEKEGGSDGWEGKGKEYKWREQ
jgi:hypothetical protein